MSVLFLTLNGLIHIYSSQITSWISDRYGSPHCMAGVTYVNGERRMHFFWTANNIGHRTINISSFPNQPVFQNVITQNQRGNLNYMYLGDSSFQYNNYMYYLAKVDGYVGDQFGYLNMLEETTSHIIARMNEMSHFVETACARNWDSKIYVVGGKGTYISSIRFLKTIY